MWKYYETAVSPVCSTLLRSYIARVFGQATFHPFGVALVGSVVGRIVAWLCIVWANMARYLHTFGWS